MTSVCSEDKEPGRVHRLSREKIIRLFDEYGFKDAIGHDLTKCSDFLELVDRACNPVSASETSGAKEFSGTS